MKVKSKGEENAEESEEDTPAKHVSKVKGESGGKNEIFLRSATIRGNTELKEKNSLDEVKEPTSNLRKNEDKKPAAAAASASKRKVSFLVCCICALSYKLTIISHS